MQLNEGDFGAAADDDTLLSRLWDGADRMKIDDLLTIYPKPYRPSGGEKQRVLIASVLAQDTDVFLLDEPTAALDLKHQISILKLLRRLSKQQQKAVVLVTHEVNLASQFCDRLILLNEGKIVKDGRPDEVLQFNLIRAVYGVDVYIDINPFTNSIYILPFDLKNGGQKG